MKLQINHIKKQFAKSTWDRGNAYYNTGRVKILKFDEEFYVSLGQIHLFFMEVIYEE